MKLRISQWSLSAIADTVDGRLVGADRAISSVSTDTRKIAPDALFVALVGPRFDGNTFVSQAAESGAAAAIVSSEQDVTIPQIVVEDTLTALQRLGAAVWKQAHEEGMKTVALTGSNGKTTTKELCSAVFRTEFEHVHATAGNLNNHIGVPLTLCAIPLECELAIVEMGANDFGDIDELVRMAPGEVRIITSIGEAHLEALGDLNGVRRVKSEIFHVPNDAIAVVPSEERRQLHLPDGMHVIEVGSEVVANLTAQDANGQSVDLEAFGKTLRLRSPLTGAHNAGNLATAIAAFYALIGRLPNEDGLNASLAGMKIPGGRWRRVQAGGWDIIDDAYNANPSSMTASFRTFSDLYAEQTRYAVIGEMLELGEEARDLHVRCAQEMAASQSGEEFVFVGRFADDMASAATDKGAKATAAVDPESAADYLRTQMPGVVFLKASRGAQLERVITSLQRTA